MPKKLVELLGIVALAGAAAGLAFGLAQAVPVPAASVGVPAPPEPEPVATASETVDAGSPHDAGEPTRHIAMMRDFVDFTAWDRYPVEGAMLPAGAVAGPTYIYVNRAVPRDRTTWPVGTVLIKVVESAPEREAWTMHAMVKRGGGFNADGAAGWEYFELQFEAGEEHASTLWRGPAPPTGHGYGQAGQDAGTTDAPLVCNDCHAAEPAIDGVLTPALALR